MILTVCLLIILSSFVYVALRSDLKARERRLTEEKMADDERSYFTMDELREVVGDPADYCPVCKTTYEEGICRRDSPQRNYQGYCQTENINWSRGRLMSINLGTGRVGTDFRSYVTEQNEDDIEIPEQSRGEHDRDPGTL